MKRLALTGAMLWLIASPTLASETATKKTIAPEIAAVLETLPRYTPGPRVTGTISVWGHGSPKHDFVGALVKRWFADFQRTQPDVKLDYRMYGTASSVGAVATGAGTLAVLGEEVSPDMRKMFMRAKGYAPTEVEIANGSVDTNYFDYAHMVFVHKDNPLAKLTLQQLAGVFGDGNKCGSGNIRTWGGLGLKGEWAAKPIQPYSWKTDVDFAWFFRGRVLCDSYRWNPATHEYMPVTQPDGSVVQHGQLILEALAKDRYGIAISNVRFANPDVKALPLAWDAKRGFHAATNATLMARQYPLIRIIPAVVDHVPGKGINPADREFLRYILSREGQTALVEDSGYLPLDRATLLREQGKLK